jgi:multidrug transporter EmrE-like cation transporter
MTDSSDIGDLRQDTARDIGTMFFRVFCSSLCFAVFAWTCFYKTYHVMNPFGMAVEHAPDIVLLSVGTYFLFAALQDWGRLFISPLFASKFVRRYRDRFFALCLPLAIVPFLSAVCTLIYVVAAQPTRLSSLSGEELTIVALEYLVPAALVVVEMLIEKHISSRRLFSEALAAMLAGVAYAVWSAVFRDQSGPLGADQYLWDLSVPLSIAYSFALVVLFVAAYFAARRISLWRWRHVLEYEDLLD